MPNDGLISAHPYDDFALVNRHGNFLLAAQVARANELGSDIVSEPALKAVRRFAAAGFRAEARKIAETFHAEIAEHYSLGEVLLAIEGCEEKEDDRPTDPCIRAAQAPDDTDYLPPTLFPPALPDQGTDGAPVHHVLPYPNVPDDEPLDISNDAVLLDDFDDERDTIVDAVPSFVAEDPDAEGQPEATDPPTE